MDLQLRAMNCCNRGHIPMAGWWVVICAFCSCAGNWDGGIDVLEMEERQGWKKLQTSNFKLHPPSSKHYGETRRNSKLQAPKGELGSAGLLSPALSSQGGEGEV